MLNEPLTLFTGLAVLVSLLSIAIQIRRWRRDKEDYYLEKQPRIRIYPENTSEHSGLKVVNVGLGPAEILNFTVTSKPQTKSTSMINRSTEMASQVWQHTVDLMPKLEPHLKRRAWFPGDLIGPNSETWILWIESSDVAFQPDSESLASLLLSKHISIEIKYRSIYKHHKTEPPAEWPPN